MSYSPNWALILTATSSTITCVAVIFLVLLFLVFRQDTQLTNDSCH